MNFPLTRASGSRAKDGLPVCLPSTVVGNADEFSIFLSLLIKQKQQQRAEGKPNKRIKNSRRRVQRLSDFLSPLFFSFSSLITTSLYYTPVFSMRIPQDWNRMMRRRIKMQLRWKKKKKKRKVSADNVTPLAYILIPSNFPSFLKASHIDDVN